MKTGKTLVQLAEEIQRQSASKRDYIVSTEGARVVADDKAVNLTFADKSLTVGTTAHDQIASHVGIPVKYYRRMLDEAPALLADNVNTWFDKQPTRQMVRTLDGKARAFLSDRYRPLDNEQLAETILPVLLELGVEIISSEITEKRLYIKAVDKRIARDIPQVANGHTFVKARVLSPTICVSNSEIGFGALSVQGGLLDGWCTNLSYFSERSTKKYHIGQKFGEFSEDQVYALLSDQSRALGDAALWSATKDVVRGAFDQARFDALVDKVTNTQSQPLTGDIPKVVEVTAAKFGFNEGERKSVLDHLIKGGDLSRFGLYNAITRAAEDLTDYDRATEFEKVGGLVVELPANDWRVIAEAA
jgi:hypothetical protein